MGDTDEFSLSVRTFLRVYRWRRIDPVPWTELEKPLSECRVALISSAGLTLPGQEPFEARPGGDASFRDIPGDADPSLLVDSHRSKSFDHEGLEADKNLAFPIERLAELERAGRIGKAHDRHVSFMGAITATGRLVRDTAPAVAASLAAEAVDAALLVPV